VEDAKIAAGKERRSVPCQIEHWARIGKAALDNPDLPTPFIQDSLRSLKETRAGKTIPYQFG
jgi:hypothetical protein